MSSTGEIDSKEIILRRIPPSDQIESIQTRNEGGGFRATSARLKPKPGELGTSCSRLLEASPRDVLIQLAKQGIPAEGWMVCRIRVADVRALGWDVIVVSMEEIPGHCEIRETEKVRFSDKLWSKLAKKTRILEPHEVENLHAGDELID